MMTGRGAPLALHGPPRERGRGQTAGGDAWAVRSAIKLSLALADQLLALAAAQRSLADLRDYAAKTAPAALAEMEGIAEGFGLAADALFAYLHLAVLLDQEQSRTPVSAADGCSAWAALDVQGHAWLGKNRDFRGEHQAIQRVFLSRDPAWGNRQVLSVGSLGAPPVYSSGINSEGLAIADTQITTDDHGVGLCRYFLMGEILARCAKVPEALDYIASIRHAGGGSLVLADAYGRRAAVELGHSRIAVEAPDDARPIVRTNHFVSPELKGATLRRPGEPMIGSSDARLARLQAAIAARPDNGILPWAVATMASHDGEGGTGLCRHGQDGDATTISTAVFACASPSLYFSNGNPCQDDWRHYGL